MRISRKTSLSCGAATAAIALYAMATPAQAACTASGTTVTCENATGVSGVNTAVNGVPPPSITLDVRKGATVTQDGQQTIDPSSSFVGAVGLNNAGAIGTNAAPVNFLYGGAYDSSASADANAASTFSLTNGGTIAGYVEAYDLGGAITASNTGAIGGGLFLNGAGNVTLTSSGTIYNRYHNVAIDVSAGRTGGSTPPVLSDATVTLTGPVAVPATTGTNATPAQPQNVYVDATGASTLSVDALAGYVDASSYAQNSKSSSSTADGTTTSASDSTAVGGNSTVTIGAQGQMRGASAYSNAGMATVNVMGSVGSDADADADAIQTGNVYAETYGSHYSSNQKTTTATDSTGTTTTSTYMSSSTAQGGDASVDVAQDAAVIGNVVASSNAGDATATIEGRVGSGEGRSIAAAGKVSANATSDDTKSTSMSMNGPNGSSSSSTYAAAAHGGNASVTVAEGADVFGSASARGDVSASVDNAGRLHGTGGDLSAISARTIETSDSNQSSFTSTKAANGTVTTVSKPYFGNYVYIYDTVGGTASAFNRATGTIDDNVTVSGLAGATFQNAGAVFGDVSLTSQGTKLTYGATSTTTTITPGSASGTSSTNAAYSYNSSDVATGGNVSGTYGGTVGALQNFDNQGSLPQQTRITQTADGRSDATLSGTIYANFQGTVGGSSGKYSSNSTTGDVTAPATKTASAVETRTYNSSYSSTTTYGSGASNATVTGRLLNNGNGTGNLSLTANAGDANLIVNGGSIDGNVDVSVGGRPNSSYGRTSKSVSSGTPGETLAEQSSSSTSFDETTANTGAATVMLTNAKLGSLYVSGAGKAAGSNGASLTMDAKSTVSGDAEVFAGAGGSTRHDSSSVAARGKSGVTRTTTDSSSYTETGGDATASVAGKSNLLSVRSRAGNATATLTGVATNGVDVIAEGTNSTDQSTSTYTGTSKTTLNTPRLTETDTSSTTMATGGTASLAINTASNLASRNTAAVATGVVDVEGLSGSTLTIARGSRVLTSLFDDEREGFGGSIFVGTLGLANTTSTSTTFYGANRATASTSRYTSTAVGGASTFTNAGVVGSRTASEIIIPHGGDDVSANRLAAAAVSGGGVAVDVEGLAGASVTNTGSIYGSIFAGSIDQNSDTTATKSNLSDAVTATGTTVSTVASVGGAASITNSGLVTGTVEADGATGVINNSGVLEGAALVGEYVPDAVTTTTSTATSQTVVQTAPKSLFTQTYAINQNGLLIGGVNVAGAYRPDQSTEPADSDHMVSKNTQINTTVNLNSGSITLGNITAETLASYTDSTDPADTLNRATNTTVNLSGNGFLGVGPNVTPTVVTSTPNLEGVIANLLGQTTAGYTYSPNYLPYVAIDSGLGTVNALGKFVPNSGAAAGPVLVSGSRITGVELVDKVGAGTFTVLGSPYLAPTGDDPNATYTMDVGTLRTSGGELQLGVSGTDPTTGAAIFGIRGNVENNAALMLGRSVSFGSSQVTEGIAVRVEGNFTQSATGTLEVGATPALIRQFGTLVLPAQAQGLLGYGQYGVTLSPFVPFGQQYIGLTSTPSTLNVTGDLTLAGKVTVAASPGAIYLAGTGRDLFTVDGKFTDNTTTSGSFGSPFVSFELTPRTVGDVTVVSLDVVRTPYSSVTTTSNAAAAADALDAAMPNVVATISSLASPQAVTDVQSYGYVQDLATVMAALDSSLSSDQAADALDELASGSFYGSLSAISTTRAFGDLALGAKSAAPGVGLWIRPVGSFSHFKGNDDTGAMPLHVDNYGGSIGFNLLTDNDGDFGIAGGYAHTRTHDVGEPQYGHADTYMVGAYGTRAFGGLHVGAQGVFGWSNWHTVRKLPLFDRTAYAKFDSKEVRITLRASYDFDIGGLIASPFAELDLRHYKFNEFNERDAGGIGLHVDDRSKTVFDPEFGGRLSGTWAGVQPYVKLSYVFQNHVGSDRNVAYLGDLSTIFTLRGVNPRGYFDAGAGLQVDLVGRARAFIDGDYLTGGHQHAGEVKGGVMVTF